MRSVFSNHHFEGGLLGYYRNAFWEMDVDPTNPETWCELRLVARQYQATRSKVQQITTFAELEQWLNERQHEVFAAPLNILDIRRYVTPYKRAHIDSVARKQINHTFQHDVMLEEQFSGKGWEVEIWFETGPGRYDQLGLKMALAAWGIYAYSISYGQNKSGAPCYQVSAYILKRDFNMTDANKARWNHDPMLLGPDLDDDDDEDDDTISQAEQRARMFEEGLLDQEIEGIYYGDR